MDTPDNYVINSATIYLEVKPSAAVIWPDSSQLVSFCTVSPVFVIIPAVFGNISETCGRKNPLRQFLLITILLSVKHQVCFPNFVYGECIYNANPSQWGFSLAFMEVRPAVTHRKDNRMFPLYDNNPNLFPKIIAEWVGDAFFGSASIMLSLCRQQQPQQSLWLKTTLWSHACWIGLWAQAGPIESRHVCTFCVICAKCLWCGGPQYPAGAALPWAVCDWWDSEYVSGTTPSMEHWKDPQQRSR